ncbi:hypothetical protein FB45DRAFT_949227 [Roridomyces roridus]|uniref:Uncharacterized protein n=1 Tax=Roridomyces roridus TaxID=1738132 RepID=A0AAD7B149_9AGAR|nr:hypothetical protein FB45DRAFT_949227 [Roridomyces roridus]
MTTTNVLLAFIAFLAGQLFNAVCSGLAHPQLANTVPVSGWSLTSVIVVVLVILVIHELVILALVWWLFTRRNKKSSIPPTTRLLPCGLPLLLLPPKPRLLLLPPLGPSPLLNIRLPIPRWMFSLRVYFAPRPQRALMAHQGNRFIVGIVWQALAAIKASRPEVAKYEHGLWLVKIAIPRPLGLRGMYRGRVIRLPRVFLAQQDLLRIVSGALTLLKASKIRTLPGMHQDDSATLVDESLDDKKSIFESPSTSRPSHLALVGHLAAAAMSRKAAKQVILQESSTEPQEINNNALPSPPIQEEEAYPDVPTPRPSLVSFLQRIPIEMLRQRFSTPRYRPQEPEASHAFIEEVEEEHDDRESLSGDSDDAELFSYEAFADDLDTGALFDRPSGPCLPKFDISRPPSLSNIAARFTTSPPQPSTSRMAMLARLRHPASTCA